MSGKMLWFACKHNFYKYSYDQNASSDDRNRDFLVNYTKKIVKRKSLALCDSNVCRWILNLLSVKACTFLQSKTKVYINTIWTERSKCNANKSN